MAVETVLRSPKYQDVVNEVVSLGGEFHMLYVGLNSWKLSAERVRNRVKEGGHDVPLEKLEVYFNGKVIASSDGSPIRKRLPIDRSGWLTVRATNSKPQHPVDDSYVVGETSPVYVYKGGRPIRSKADSEYFLQWIDDITKQAQAHPGWRSEKERSHVIGQFQQARKVFDQRVKETQ